MASARRSDSAALAESAQTDTIPVRADSQRSGGVHACGLGGGLHGGRAGGSRTTGLRRQHPQWAVIAEHRVGIDDGIGQRHFLI